MSRGHERVTEGPASTAFQNLGGRGPATVLAPRGRPPSYGAQPDPKPLDASLGQGAGRGVGRGRPSGWGRTLQAAFGLKVPQGLPFSWGHCPRRPLCPPRSVLPEHPPPQAKPADPRHSVGEPGVLWAPNTTLQGSPISGVGETRRAAPQACQGTSHRRRRAGLCGQQRLGGREAGARLQGGAGTSRGHGAPWPGARCGHAKVLLVGVGQ